MNWIVECFTSISYSVKVNDEKLSLPFKAKKGHKQGDLLSLYLFAIRMEYISRRMSSLQQNSAFYFHPKCKIVGLTHLMFAYDWLLFCKADRVSIQLLME